MYGDEDDNLVILYPALNGELETYDNGTKNNPDTLFKRIRLKEPRPYVDRDGRDQLQKYTQPAGTRQLPFFMPGMIAKYLAGEKIKTLYLVEGELKAAAGFTRGLDIIGMPSNAVVHEQKGGFKVLDAQLAAFIRKCQVETIVLLHDADALTVKWEQAKDLAKRPASFASAVVSFRELLQPLLDEAEESLGLLDLMLKQGADEPPTSNTGVTIPLSHSEQRKRASGKRGGK